jgi:hypothetical protein
MINQTTTVTGLFNSAHLCPLPLALCLLKPVAHVCTLKMAEDGLSVTLPLPMDVPSRVINLLSLPPPGLVIWRLGAGGGPGIWSLRSLGLGFKTPVSHARIDTPLKTHTDVHPHTDRHAH